MRSIILIICCVFAVAVNAQTTTTADTLRARSRLILNGYRANGISDDTSSANKRSDYLITEKAAKAYVDSSKTRFKSNVIAKLPSLKGVGKYVNGDTIPAAGKTLDEFLFDIATQAISPTYTAPTVSISSSPSGGSYEMGSNIGTITLSSTFTQNNAGTSTGSVYSKYISSWNNLGGTTDGITSLTVPTYYRVTTSYNQGACLNNNLGVQDCTGRITAGSVTSGNVVFTPFQKRYWGFVSSPTPSDADILALTQDANGSTVGLSLSSITPTGSQYLVYVRPNSGSVSGITVNGFPSLSAFTTTTRSFVNAQGYSSSYQIIISNNPQTGTLDSVIFN